MFARLHWYPGFMFAHLHWYAGSKLIFPSLLISKIYVCPFSLISRIYVCTFNWYPWFLSVNLLISRISVCPFHWCPGFIFAHLHWYPGFIFAHLHWYPGSIFEHLLWLSGPQRAILQLPRARFYIIRQHWYPDHIVHLNMMDHSQVSKVSINIFPDIQVHVGVDIQGLYWSSSWFSWSIYTDVHWYPGYIFSILQISKIHFTHLYHGTLQKNSQEISMTSSAVVGPEQVKKNANLFHW